MPNFLEMLRLKNIFNPEIPLGNDLPSQGGITGNMPIPNEGLFSGNKPKTPWDNLDFGAPAGSIPPIMSPSGEMDFDVSKRMSELYTPETGASDRFNTMLGEYPQREKPGIWRSIAGALTAFGPGGHELGMRVANEPYLNKMEDWKSQIGPAQSAANLERQTNANERTMAYGTVSQELRDRSDRARVSKDEARTKVMQDRAEVYRLKSAKGNFKFDFSGPKVLMADPATGQVQQTDIDTGSLSDADKMALSQEHALDRIEATGGEARKTEDLRQTGREGLAETRGWGQPVEIADPSDPNKRIAVSINAATGAVKRITLDDQAVSGITKPGTGDTSENATQSAKRQFSNARRLVLSRPDLAPFLTVKKGDFSLKGKPSPTQLKEINDAIYGASSPSAPISNTAVSNRVPPTMTPDIAARIPAGRVAMFKDGQTVTIPQDQLQQAIEEGYVQVK